MAVSPFDAISPQIKSHNLRSLFALYPTSSYRLQKSNQGSTGGTKLRVTRRRKRKPKMDVKVVVDIRAL